MTSLKFATGLAVVLITGTGAPGQAELPRTLRTAVGNYVLVAGSVVEKGYETCGAIKGKMEVLLHEARTECQPAYDNGKIALILASPLPVFRSPEGKRAWFLAVVAVVGYETRRAGLSEFSAIYVMDSDSVKTLDSYSMPVARAATLQKQVKDEQITSETYLSSVMAEMQPAKMPQRFMP